MPDNTKHISHTKNIFAIGFAISFCGILISSEPNYLLKILEFLGIDGNYRPEFQSIKILGGVQTLVGGLWMAASGFWLSKLLRDQE